MLQESEKNILKLLKLGPLFIILIFIIVMYIIFNSHNKLLEQQINQIKDQALQEKKTLIKREVESVYNYIDSELNRTRTTIKQNAKNRVYEAIAIANSIYKNNLDKNEKEIKRLITDALRDIRFNDNRGYFFINDLKAKSIMNPNLPEIEGKSIWDFQDKKGAYPAREAVEISQKYKEGYLTYWWDKPDNKKDSFEKISFVKLFEPFNWTIGTGEYVINYETKLKDELLSKIQNVKFGKNGYIFISDEKGITLSHINKNEIGKNRINLKDKNGVEIIKEVIKVAKKGEGYISYIGTIKPSTGEAAEKISFVKGFDKWNWAIGAGLYVDELNSQIEEKNNIFIKNDNSQFKKMLFINFIFFGALFIASLFLARITKNRFLQYNHAVNKKTKELEELNKTLEDKVEIRTKEQNSLLALFEEGDSVLVRWNNDENWSVDYVSSNVSNLLGYEKEEFLSGSIAYADCIHKDDLQQTIDDDIYRRKENKEFYRHLPYRIVTKDGVVKWILEYNLIIRNEKGDITHYLGYLMDETSNQTAREELVIAKKEAINASQAKSEFLANMSHEIRTPMNGIIGMTTLALSKIDTDVIQAKDFTKKAKNSANMLLGVINDILDFSKIEARKIDIEKTPVYLGEILSQMNDLFSYTASQKDIKFIIEHDNMVPEYILGDKLRLTQVLTNLISNALKFTQKGSIKLKIELLSKDGDNIKLKFSVSDTGKGIAKENQNKLFKSFAQEDSTISRKYGGTGLGLTISKNLVSLMDGEIDFTSVENEGSTFFFTLNTTLIQEKSIQKKEKTTINHLEQDNEILDARILLVEDNETNQELAYNFLSQIVKEIEIVNNGQEAIDILDSKEKDYYKLVLMDIHMPVLDGNTATIKIKEQEKYKELAIIAMTANVIKKDLEYSIKCGMCDYVTKPFEVQELFDKVKYWINKKEKVKTIAKKVKVKKDGIDFDEAIDRMMGQKDLYKGFLESFLKNDSNSFSDLEKLIQRKDLNEVISKAHTLKGVYGTIGAGKLSDLFRQIEESFKTKHTIDENLLEETKKEIEKVSIKIKEWIKEN